MTKSLKPLKTLAGGMADRFASANNRFGETEVKGTYVGNDWALGHLYDEVYEDDEPFLSIVLVSSNEQPQLSPVVTSVAADFLTMLHRGLRRGGFSDDVVEEARIDIRFTPDPTLKIAHLARCRIEVFITDFLGRVHSQSRDEKVLPQRFFTRRL